MERMPSAVRRVVSSLILGAFLLSSALPPSFAQAAPPTVAITQPTLSGQVTLVANPTSDVGVAGVTFEVNGATIGSEITSAPYQTTWDTTTVPNGSYTILAIVRDTTNTFGTSTPDNVTVYNVGSGGTGSTTPPMISSISSGIPGQTSATITWSTDTNSDSTVNYGTTTTYGSVSYVASSTMAHSVTLSGLTAGTTYHFEVSSTDSSGNTATSTDQSFTTAASSGGTGSSTPPVISSISSGYPFDTSAVVTWTTDIPSQSTVNYGPTSTYGLISSLPALTTSHSVTLTGLTASTTYHFQVSSTGSAGGVATSADQTLTTTPTLSPRIMVFGDSRTQNGGGVSPHVPSTGYTSEVKPSGSYSGCIPLETNNMVYYAPDWNFGVGAQSTAGFMSRYSTPSTAMTGGTAANFVGAGGSITTTDNEFNIESSAAYSSLTDPSNVVIFMGGANDVNIGPASPKNQQSMINIGNLLDAWRSAGKVVFLANELPTGVGTAYRESYTIPAGGGSYTTAHASTYLSNIYVSYMPTPGGPNDGVTLTKVASNPGAGQYSVSNGVYTFSAADAGATVGIDYSFVGTARGGAANTALHLWLSSNAPDFVDPTGVDYHVPGALYNRTWVIPVDTWDTIADPSQAAHSYNLPNTLLDGLHPTDYGCQLIGKSFAAALQSRLPATDYSNLPTGEMESLVRANGTNTTYSSNETSPVAKPFMKLPITPGTFKIIAGSVTGTDNGSGIITGTGIASSTINYSTGAWSITFTTKPAVNTVIYGTTDPTTIISNGLLNPANGFSPISSMGGCTGACLTSGNLTSSNGTGIPNGFTASIDSSTAAQIASGTMKIDLALSTTTSDGFPEMQLKISGVTGAAGMAITFLANAVQSLALNQLYRGTSVDKIDAGPNGHLYGLNGIETKVMCQAATGTSFTPIGEPTMSNGATGRPIYAGRSFTGGTGFTYTDSDISGGELRIPVLTQSCDTSTMTGSPSGIFSFILSADPNTPISATVHLSRLSFKPYSY